MKFKNAANSFNKQKGIISEFIIKQLPVHFGGMSDPFQPIEKNKKISLKVLEYLCSIEYPIIISTKSDILSTEPYLSILKSNKKVLVQYSFSSINDNVAKIIEPHSTPPSLICKSIEKISSNNIKTAIRWQPFIPRVSENPDVFISHVKNLGIRHLGFEHLKLSTEKNSLFYRKLLEYFNFDIKQYYKQHKSRVDGREYVLPINYKLHLVNQIKSELKNLNITFGAADNELQHLSDTDCCCSGIDQFTEFGNWYKFQIAYAIKKSRGKTIYFKSIADEWKPNGSIDQYINSNSRLPKQNATNTVYDYIKERWNNLNSPFNPTKFYKIFTENKRDTEGFLIYKWY